MKRIAALGLLVLLAGCAGDGIKPEPVVVTQKVEVAVPVPCEVKAVGRPVLMTREQLWAALDATQDSGKKAAIVTEQLLAYMGWTPVVEAALGACDERPAPR